MSNFLRQSRYILLFSCLAVLAIILASVLWAPSLINAVQSNPDISTQFNFPRYKSDAEIATPPEIKENVRYTLIQTDEVHQGREVNWTHILDDGPYDVVIISDSFLVVPAGSNICRRISAENNVSVLHIYANFFNYSGSHPFRMLVLLINNGFIRKTGARVVILESAERMQPLTIVRTSELTRADPLPPVEFPENVPMQKDSPAGGPPVASVQSMIGVPFEWIDLFFDNGSRDLTTLKTWIKNELFSVTASQTADGTLEFLPMNESRFTSSLYGSRLIIHQTDITTYHTPDARMPDDIIQANDNLNQVARNLHSQNITLIFIPGVSAYNTYYPYIIDPPTARNPFFEMLRELRRSYILIDTKAIADQLQARGEKDLSGVGDPAHWTWKMTGVVADTIDLNAIPDTHPPLSPREREEEYDRAVLAFRSVIYERGESRDPWALKIDGEIYERAHDYRNASRCYERSLALSPWQPNLWIRLENITENYSGQI
jgi:hypothetical protein